MSGCSPVNDRANYLDHMSHFENVSLRIRPYIPARTDRDIYGPLVARCVAERGQAPSIIVYQRT